MKRLLMGELSYHRNRIYLAMAWAAGLPLIMFVILYRIFGVKIPDKELGFLVAFVFMWSIIPAMVIVAFGYRSGYEKPEKRYRMHIMMPVSKLSLALALQFSKSAFLIAIVLAWLVAFAMAAILPAPKDLVVMLLLNAIMWGIMWGGMLLEYWSTGPIWVKILHVMILVICGVYFFVTYFKKPTAIILRNLPVNIDWLIQLVAQLNAYLQTLHGAITVNLLLPIVFLLGVLRFVTRETYLIK